MKNDNINNDAEEEKEDEELSKRYSSRLDLPEDQWIRRPPGMSHKEFFEQWPKMIKEMKEEKNKGECLDE